MSIKTLTCVEAACDDCGSVCWDDNDYGTPHFTSVEDALKSLAESYGWTITEAEQLCAHCAVERRCEAEGHKWGPWMDSPNYLDPDWQDKPAERKQRFCDRDYCHAREQEPLTSPSAPGVDS